MKDYSRMYYLQADIFWGLSPASHFVSIPVFYIYYFSSRNTYQFIFFLPKILLNIPFWQKVHICQHKSHLIFPFVLRVFQTLSICNGPCNKITLLGNWTSNLQTSRKLFKYGKKSDPGIETNDDINVKVYFSTAKTINLINKH